MGNKIEYRPGDMFAGNHTYFVHGCNAQGVMGSGVARQVATDYPMTFAEYRRVYEMDGLNLGQVIRVGNPNGHVIFNAITQNQYGRDGQRYANYGAIDQAFKWISSYFGATNRRHHDLAMPMIGAGLGRGDWNTIAGIIEKNAIFYQPIVYDWTP